MKTKTTFSVINIIAGVFLLFSFGTSNIMQGQNTKQVVNLPDGDQFYSSHEGYEGTCRYIVVSGGDKLIIYTPNSNIQTGYDNLKSYSLPDNNQTFGVAVKPGSRDTIVFVKSQSGDIYEYAVRGCPPQLYLLESYKPVPAQGSGPEVDAVFTEALGTLFVEENGVILSTKDSGNTWLNDTIGLGGNCTVYPNGMGQDTDNNIFILSTDYSLHQGLFFQPTNSNSWTKIPHFVSGNSGLVRVDNKNHLWVITDSISYSADGGNSWKSHLAPGNNIIQECMDVYGYIYVISSTKMYRSADSGVTWTRIGASISNSIYDTTVNQIFNDIIADTLLSLATNYGMYYSSDKGNTWRMDSIPAENIYGYQQYPNGRKICSTPLATYLQKKGDTTWTQTYPAGVYYPYNPSTAGNAWYRPLPKIQQDASGHLFMLGFNAIGVAFNTVWDALRSNDSGSTWLQDTLGMAAMAPHSNYTLPPYYVDSMGGQHMCISSNPALVYSKTLSGGWAIDTLGMGAGGLIFAEAFIDANGYLYAAGQAKYTTQYNGRVMRRPITGGSWVVDTSGIGSQWIYTLSKDSKGNIMASEPSTVSTTFLPKLFYRSAATGKWNSATTPTYHNMVSITGNNPGEWLAYTNYYWGNFSFPYYTNDGVYCSTDSGATWNMIALDSTYIYQLETIGDTVFALTGDGLYKNLGCTNNISTGLQNVTSQIQHSAAVYPNPNNGNFALEYNLPDATGELRIIDVTGREVYSSIITNQQGKQTINATILNEGIYFWQVYSGDKLIDKGKIAVVK
jgi:hypothetical protein